MQKKTLKSKPVKANLKKVITKKPITSRKPPLKVKGQAEGILPQALWGLHNLKAPLGSHKRKRILGRGPSSGHGKTSTRGSKGQTSRAGRVVYAGFEGGQMPLIRTVPKRGFTSKFKREYQIVNLTSIAKVKESIINPELLAKMGLIKNKNKLVKILGEGQIKVPVTIHAHAFSKVATEKIKNSGGKSEIINA